MQGHYPSTKTIHNWNNKNVVIYPSRNGRRTNFIEKNFCIFMLVSSCGDMSNALVQLVAQHFAYVGGNTANIALQLATQQ